MPKSASKFRKLTSKRNLDSHRPDLPLTADASDSGLSTPPQACVLEVSPQVNPQIRRCFGGRGNVGGCEEAFFMSTTHALLGVSLGDVERAEAGASVGGFFPGSVSAQSLSAQSFSADAAGMGDSGVLDVAPAMATFQRSVDAPG
jgi:hypothetical protein